MYVQYIHMYIYSHSYFPALTADNLQGGGGGRVTEVSMCNGGWCQIFSFFFFLPSLWQYVCRMAVAVDETFAVDDRRSWDELLL